jgi:hypothetical protein
VLGFSPLRAGLAFLPFIAGVVVAANFVSNKGLDRFGPKIVVPAGMILAAGAAAWLTGLGVHGGYGTRVAPALVNSSNQIGGSLGAALLNTIAAAATANYLTSHVPHVSVPAATVHGDVTAFVFLIVLFAAGAVVTALLYPRRPHRA